MSGELGPGLTWNPTDYTIAYDGRPLGANADAPILAAELIFTADDGRPSSAPPSAAPANRPPVWQPELIIQFVEGFPAVVSVRDFVRDPDSDPLVIALKSGELVPGLTWNPTDYTIAYDGRPLGAQDDAPIVITGLVFTADDGKP